MQRGERGEGQTNERDGVKHSCSPEEMKIAMAAANLKLPNTGELQTTVRTRHKMPKKKKKLEKAERVKGK